MSTDPSPASGIPPAAPGKRSPTPKAFALLVVFIIVIAALVIVTDLKSPRQRTTPAASQPAVLVLRNNSAQFDASFGDGLLCVNGTGITRLAARIAINGFSQHTISHGAGAGTFFYQLWYRNNPMTFCSATDAFNTSNALTLLW